MGHVWWLRGRMPGSERFYQWPTLEDIIALTGEFGHLNELVCATFEKGDRFDCKSMYFAAVNPILDHLEAEIRSRHREGMSSGDLKEIISAWIEEEKKKIL
jgi:hypothetical protein